MMDESLLTADTLKRKAELRRWKYFCVGLNVAAALVPAPILLIFTIYWLAMNQTTACRLPPSPRLTPDSAATKYLIRRKKNKTFHLMYWLQAQD